MRAAIDYIIKEVARQNDLEPGRLPGDHFVGTVLQKVRDIENRRESFAKVIQRFHNPREGWTMVHGIREAIEGALATLPPPS